MVSSFLIKNMGPTPICINANYKRDHRKSDSLLNDFIFIYSVTAVSKTVVCKGDNTAL